MTDLATRIDGLTMAAEYLLADDRMIWVDEAACRGESDLFFACLLYTSPSPRDQRGSRMPSSA